MIACGFDVVSVILATGPIEPVVGMIDTAHGRKLVPAMEASMPGRCGLSTRTISNMIGRELGA